MLLDRRLAWGLVGLLIVLRFSAGHYRAAPSLAMPLETLGDAGLNVIEHGPHGPFRWTDGEASLAVSGTGSSGSLHLRAYFPPEHGERAVVRLHGHAASFRPSAELRTLTIFAPGGGAPGPAELTISSGAAWSAAESRPLGLAVLGLGWISYERPVALTGAEALALAALALRLLAGLAAGWRAAARALLDVLRGAFDSAADEPRPLLRLAVLLSLLLQLPMYNGVSERPGGYIGAFYLMGLALMFLAVSLRGRAAAGVLLAGAVAMGVELRVRWANAPTNGDVFWANMQAAQLMLAGRNPYAEVLTWVTIHPRYEWYGYLPFTIVSQIPFFLLGDIRWGLALYDLGAIGLIFLLGRRFLDADKASAIAAFLLLYAPLTEFTLINGIVDPVMIFWIIASVYLLSSGRWRWAALTAGLAMACKQYGLIYGLALAPYLLRRRQWGAVALLAAVPALIIAPYLLWSPRDFLYDTLALHASFPPIPQPFAGVWNTSLPAQWAGMAQLQGAGALRSLKQAANALSFAFMAIIGLRHLFRPTLKQVLGTTVSLLCVLFLWNAALTQSFYWRTIVLLLAAWGCFWRGSGDEPAAGAAAPDRPPQPAPPASR